MANHDAIHTHTPAFSAPERVANQGVDTIDGQTDYALLADKIRSAFHTAVNSPFTENAPNQASTSEVDNFPNIVQFVEQFNDRKPSASQVELSKPVSAYKFEEKLAILHDRLGVVPGGRTEATSAFWLLHHSDRGEDAATGISSIAGHQYRVAKKKAAKNEEVSIADAEAGAADGEASAMRVRRRKVSDYDAFATHAEASLRNLKQVRADVEATMQRGERYDNLAQFFAVTGAPWHERGQATRYVANVLKTMGVPFTGDTLAFSPTLGKDSRNRSIIHDPFIAREPSKEMVSLEYTLLGAVPMESALRILGYAQKNEMTLSKFWTEQREAALKDEVIQTAANMVLRSLSA